MRFSPGLHTGSHYLSQADRLLIWESILAATVFVAILFVFLLINSLIRKQFRWNEISIVLTGNWFLSFILYHPFKNFIVWLLF